MPDRGVIYRTTYKNLPAALIADDEYPRFFLHIFIILINKKVSQIEMFVQREKKREADFQEEHV